MSHVPDHDHETLSHSRLLLVTPCSPLLYRLTAQTLTKTIYDSLRTTVRFHLLIIDIRYLYTIARYYLLRRSKVVRLTKSSGSMMYSYLMNVF